MRKLVYAMMASLDGATLAETCIKKGLVAEYLIYVNPVVLGGGRPMFPKEINLSLRLIENRPFGCGVVRMKYEIINP